MAELTPDLDDYCGVVSARRGDDVLGEWALGLADRTSEAANTVETRFGLASGTKTFTALSVLSLVGKGVLSLETAARDVLGEDLPLIADDVTIDHLLTHTSGIGDYLDEELDDLAPLSLPVQVLDSTPAYLPLLDGFPTKFAAGERFSYCNSGYVVLAVIAERVSGTPFAEFVTRTVFEPAGMSASTFPRSDLLPVGTATGYKDDGRTNVFELPVLGSGDGGAHSTVGDLHRFWLALLGGRIVPPDLVALLIESVTPDTGDGIGYGRGVWHDAGDLVIAGSDHGVTAVSRHDVATGTTVTGLANIRVPTFARTRSLMAAARDVGGDA
ncbi:serine hydrolase domain-containing protein [Microbacterium sp. M3]|uniref:Serine hydrolase domain-containing protein n=1 Tax=Microbacterium arthrosphaerae TaxID=792652 RepID=A0ABU4H0B0_9MICO|nr:MULTISPECIES: serine hydrolase domain-containing protein [Microbacterium]MDW4572766.1 serine hydrolase domain-containing protein [Microbacterium arthrosphaerae]MDW7606621.1 serine hydrolase domain-containing protein [Microbacterium sp. M3]